MDHRTDSQELIDRLEARVARLTALVEAGRILQDTSSPPDRLLTDVLRALAGAWRYADLTVVRVFFRDLDVRSPHFRAGGYTHTTCFTTASGESGGVDVRYPETPTTAPDTALATDDSDLAGSLAEMLRSYFERVTEHDHARERVEGYQGQLRRLAAELSLAEARQRRIIAGELHDHIGQALAFIRMRLTRLQGDVVFSGFENSVADILRLVEQAINTTRSLTFQISPTVLYELGLQAGLEWLGEQLGHEQGVDIRVDASDAVDSLPDDTRVVLFQAVRELIVNALKHAAPREVRVTADLQEDVLTVTVNDDGGGFDVASLQVGDAEAMTFGLFSIRERLEYLGGSMEVTSQLGAGTSVILRTPVLPDIREDPS